MQAFNFICHACGNQLLETGLLLSSTGQCPFVCCDVCRALYYIEVLENFEGKAVIVVEPTRLEPEQEYDIIRAAEKRTPLREYLEQVEQSEKQIDPYENYLPSPNAENINPHFNQDSTTPEKKDLKSIIEKAVTPSDVIRGLNGK